MLKKSRKFPTGIVIIAIMLATSGVVRSDTIWYDSEGFEQPLFILGNLAAEDMYSGQDGWVVTADIDHSPNLDGITVQSSFVHDEEQAVEFDASVQNIDYAHLRRNVVFEPLPQETYVNIVMDFYIAESGNRSEVWGLDVQNSPMGRLTKWLVWDDNSVTVLDPNINDWVNTGFVFERNTWYNICTSINFETMVVDLIIDNVWIYSVDVIDQMNLYAFASIYLGTPGDDRAYFDNFTIQSEFTTGIETIVDQIPLAFDLNQNYPNPFNASTSISYLLPEQSKVKIEIYDILGNRIQTLLNGYQPAGKHEIIWHAVDVSSGMYFYKLQADGYTETKKMLFLK